MINIPEKTRGNKNIINMKNLDLNSYGIQELDAAEMNEISGGFYGCASSRYLVGTRYHKRKKTFEERGMSFDPKVRPNEEILIREEFLI
jgi:hypothetical protein